MSCTVDFKNEKIKAQFTKEAERSGARAALMSILNQADSSRYLSMEKELRENAMFSQVIGKLLNPIVSGGGNIADKMRSLDLELESGQAIPEVLQGPLAEIAEELAGKLEFNALDYSVEGNEASAQRASSIYAVLQNFDELARVTSERISKLHKQLNGEVEVDVTVLQELEDLNPADVIHSQDKIEQGTDKLISKEIVALLSILPKYTMNKAGKLVASYDDLGFRELGDVQATKSYLINTLVDKTTFAEMYQAIQEDSAVKPEAAGLSLLLADIFKAKNSKVSVFGKTYNVSENAFYSSFRAANYGLINVTTREMDYTERTPDGGSKRSKKTVASIFNAGEQTRFVDIRKQFDYTLDEIALKDVKLKAKVLKELKAKYSALFTDTNSKNGKRETYVDPIDGQTKQKADSRLLAVNSKIIGKGHDKGINILVQYKNMLNDLGMDVNIATMAELKRIILAKHRVLQNKEKKTAAEKAATTQSSQQALNSELFDGQYSLLSEIEGILTGKFTKANLPSASGLQSVRLLAKAKANKGEKYTSAGAITGADGNTRNTASLVDMVSDVFTFLGKKGSDIYTEYVNDPILKHSLIVDLFSNPKGVNPEIGNTLLYDNKKTKSVQTYKSMTTQEMFAFEIAAFKNTTYVGKDRVNAVQIVGPTMSDRKHAKVISLSTTKTAADTSNGVINTDMWNNATLHHMYAVVKSINTEVARINQVRRDVQEMQGDKASLLIPGYNTPNNKGVMFGDKFCYWPELQDSDIFVEDANGLLALNTEKYDTTGIKGSALNSELDRLLGDFVQDEVEYYVNSNVIKAQDETKKSKFHLLTDVMGELMENTNVPNVGITAAVSKLDFKKLMLYKRAVVNDITSITLGDISYLAEKAKSLEDLMSPASKRTGMVGTNGTKLRTGKGGAAVRYGVAVLNDIESVNEELAAQLDRLTGGEKWSTTETNVTDGVGFCTLERLAEILGSNGELSKKDAIALEELNKDNLEDINWDNVSSVFDIQKGFYLAQRYDPSYGRVMPKNSKYSLVPIIPAMVNAKTKDGKLVNPTLSKLLKRMQEGGTTVDGVDIPIGEAVFKSTFKLGAVQVNDLDSSDPLKVTTFHNEHWLRPQVTKQKTSNYTGIGAQIRAMIVGNLPKSSVFNGKTAAQVAQSFDNSLKVILNDNMANTQRKLVDGNGVVDKRKLASQTALHLEKTSMDGVVSRDVKMLRKVVNGVLNTTRLRPISTKVQKALAKMSREDIKIKLAGTQAVQVTALGHDFFTADQGETSSDLKMARVNKNGDVVAAEIKVTPHYFVVELQKRLTSVKRKIKSDNAKLTMLEGITETSNGKAEKARLSEALSESYDNITSINNVLDEMKKGTYDINKIPNSLREVVAYRVPTQEKSSFLPCKIVGFTPHSFGQAIIVPAEFTTSSGSDYDIDKLFLVFDEVSISADGGIVSNIGNDKIRNAKRDIKRTMMDVIMHPSVFKSVVDVNSVDAITKHDETLARLYPEQFGSENRNSIWGASSTQNDLRIANQSSGLGISDSMIFLKSIQIVNRMGITLGRQSNAAKYRAKRTAELTSEMNSEIASSPDVVNKATKYTRGEKSFKVEYMNDGSVRRTEGKAVEVLGPDDALAFKVSDVESYEVERLRVTSGAEDIISKYDAMISDLANEDVALSEEVIEVSIMPDAGINILPETEDGIDIGMESVEGNVLITQLDAFQPGKMYSFSITNDLLEGSPEYNDMLNSAMSAIESGAQVKLVGDDTTTFVNSDIFSDLGKTVVEGSSVLLAIPTQDVSIDELSEVVKHGSISDSINFENFLVNGKHPKLSGLTEEEVAAVAQGFVAWSSAALDSPEMTGRYNLTSNTKDAFGFLTAIGQMDYAIMLVNHPAVRAFCQEVDSESTLNYYNAVKIAKKNAGATLEYKDMSQPELERSFSNAGEYSQVVSNFLALSDIGNNLYQVFIAMNTDTKGVHSTPSNAVLKQEALTSIRGTNSYKASGDPLASNNAFVLDNDLYNDHHMSTYEKILDNHLKNISTSAIEGTPGFKSTVSRVEKEIGKKLNAKTRQLLEADVYTYIISDGNTIVKMSNEKAASLFMGENSVMKQLLELKKIETANHQDNSYYEGNGFISRLTPRKEVVTVGKDVVEMEFVDFDTKAWANGTPQSVKNDVTEDFAKLLEDPETREFAINLIQADIYRSGTSYSNNSIAPVIPDEFWTTSYKEGVPSVASELVARESDLTSQNLAGIGGDSMVMSFISNRYEELGIRELPKSAEGKKKLGQLSQVAIVGTKIKVIDRNGFVVGTVGDVNTMKDYFLPIMGKNEITIAQANELSGIEENGCIM